MKTNCGVLYFAGYRLLAIIIWTVLGLQCCGYVSSNENDGDKLVEAGQKVFDIIEFGAVGRCPTDDSDAIQKAIDLASKSKGVVFIPAGHFCIGKTINMRSHVTIRGTGDCSTIHALGDFDCIRHEGDDKSKIVDTIIRKVHITGAGVPSAPGLLSSLIAMRGHVENAIIEECLLTNSSYDAWFALKDCANIQVINNRVIGTRDDGLNPGGSSEGKGARDVLVKGNIIQNVANDGIHVSINSHNVRVVDNTISNCKNGIGFYKSSDSIIENNKISNCNNGIRIIKDIVSRVLIRNNIIQNSLAEGIALSSKSSCILMYSNEISQSSGLFSILDTGNNLAIANIVEKPIEIPHGAKQDTLSSRRVADFLRTCEDGAFPFAMKEIRKILNQ